MALGGGEAGGVAEQHTFARSAARAVGLIVVPLLRSRRSRDEAHGQSQAEDHLAHRAS
jgi:hypothetical protein